MVKSGGDSLCLFGCQVIIVTLHPGGGVLLHLVAAVRIDIQRKTGGSMAQQVLYALYISTGGNRYGGGCAGDRAVWRPACRCWQQSA